MFLQDIAVKLNDFGVLVQLLVVDFFKFCFRNANDVICKRKRSRHLDGCQSVTALILQSSGAKDGSKFCNAFASFRISQLGAFLKI